MADPGTTRTSPGDAPLLDAIFAGAPVGMAVWDRELRFQRINAELAAMNGVPAEDHLGRRLRDVLSALGPQLESLLTGILDSGDPVSSVEITGETPAAPGLPRHWIASYVPVREDGQVTGIAGFVVEVTRERIADERSATFDAELDALYSALPVGVAFLSPDLRYQRVNETLARMNGRPVEAHLGASLRDILGPPAEPLADALREVMATRRPLDLQLAMVPPGAPDEPRDLEVVFFPVLDGDGGLLGVGGVVHDVTERQRLEAEQSRLLREALLARAQAEAAQVRADDAREEAERARAEAERSRARMAFLVEAGRRMAVSMDWEATLHAVVRLAVPQVADWATLTLVDARGRLHVAAIAHEDPALERLAAAMAERYPLDPGALVGAAQVVRTGEPEVLADMPPELLRAAAQSEEHARMLIDVGSRHAITVPLRAPAGVMGTLSLLLGHSGRRFGDEDVSLARALAARAALHLQNARLYTERSHIARTLQASLRPRALPEIPGVDLAARFLPAGDQNEVGGDFYDLFPSGDGSWAAIVGDVSGKGAEAAAITALARHTLRTAALLHDAPAGNLALLNRALHDDSPAPDFCTVLYARLRPGSGTVQVRFANGGHPTPLVLRRDGTVERLEGGRGPIVGVFPGARFRDDGARLAPGDLLLLHTDGVTEVRTTDPQLGERELHATLAAHAGAPAAAVAGAVMERATALQDGPPRDDMALVVIRSEDRA